MILKNKLNVLIGLDLSEMDDSLISYIKVLHQLLPLGQITFIHNIKQSELPESLRSPEKLKVIANTIKHKLTTSIPKNIDFPCSYSTEVTLADYTELAFIKASKQFDTDLIVLGNKQHLEGNGGLSHKLIRVLPMATLLVPETFNPNPKLFVEAVDFSKYTPIVVKWGNHIEKLSSSSTLVFQPLYVSKVSWTFFPGLSLAEIRENTMLDTKKSALKWLKLYPDAAPLNVKAAEDKNIASTLKQYVRQQKVDFVILGVQGVTSLTTLFMGSVANEFIQMETDACLLLVKHTVLN
ncbi:nucleotide-binding universal stress UspA family protein [Pedobacter sp. CG_S7]|uniref:universal stress protein n=1 Tax=Pedobacter sp. CG_S7 TaxID=3143930 RepID=UPI0033941EC9